MIGSLQTEYFCGYTNVNIMQRTYVSVKIEEYLRQIIRNKCERCHNR